jgi:TPP-dependent trihydroxycyclohexane-1,2-dione (THcHDO) dehydratase
MSKSVNLTAAQAIVLYLQHQYSELDGKLERLIFAMFGIFGHGNVAGLGEALEEYGTDLPRHLFNEAALETQPLAGDIFSITVGVAGMVDSRFGG